MSTNKCDTCEFLGSQFRIVSFFLFALLAFPTNNSLAQIATGSSFERICEFGREFLELSDQWNKNGQLLQKTSDESENLKQRMMGAVADMQAINTAAGRAFQAQVLEYLQANQLEKDVSTLHNKLSESGNFGTSPVLRGLMDLHGQARASVYNIEQQLAQLGVAERATAERQMKIMMQMQENQRQRVQTLNNYLQLSLRCFEQSDLAGTRSRLENKSVLHALDQADPDNLGARLAASVALVRLGQLDETLNMLDGLSDVPPPISQIVAAIRSETLALQGKSQAAKKELGKTNNSNLPSVIILRARTFQILGDAKNAAQEWEKLGQHETYQLNARSYLMLNRLPHTTNDAQIARYVEEGRVLDELSGGQNWLCKIALALALSAHKNQDEAIAAAEEAAELAIGDKRSLCREIAEQLKADQTVKWKWD